ncbi:MAG TPA: lipocalin-like domain-containing protein, partial [Nitrospiraceae bacterium]|nr:lipocalin-like domain-containing protein [Nitrospiraceae bacterium]
MNEITRKGRQRISLVILIILFATFLATDPEAGNLGVSPASSDAGFRQASPGYHYRFPLDHGSHDEFRTEWWYYTGNLSTESGRRFGYQLTFFRRGLAQEQIRANPSRWAIRHLYLAHFAVSDLDKGRFRYAEKTSRAGLGKAGVEAGRLLVWIDRWLAEAPSSKYDPHHLKASAEDFSIDLTLTPEKPPVAHGDQGVSRKGNAPGQASHYYSLTRLGTIGTLSINGEPQAVTGLSWMDHEFGSADLAEDLVGWDWFSVQLDNHHELMFYRLRRADGNADPASSGTMVFPDGRSHHLLADDMQIEVVSHWTSQASRARYPGRWRIAAPKLGLSLDLVPRLSDQELMTSRSTQVTYWEGAVDVTGMFRGIAVAG